MEEVFIMGNRFRERSELIVRGLDATNRDFEEKRLFFSLGAGLLAPRPQMKPDGNIVEGELLAQLLG